MAKTFFKTGKHGLFVARLHIDHAVASKPHLSNRRSKQILPGNAPKHLAFGSGGNACCKQGCSRTMDRAIAAAGHFMQAAKCKPSTWQNAVYRFDAKGKNLRCTRPSSLQPFNTVTKLGKDRCG